VCLVAGSASTPSGGSAGETHKVGIAGPARLWSRRALAVSQRFDRAADKRLNPKRALLHDVAAADTAAVVLHPRAENHGGPRGKRAVRCRDGEWCMPPEPLPWQEAAREPLLAHLLPALQKTAGGTGEEDASVAKPAIRRVGSGSGGTNSEATGALPGGQSSISVWLRASPAADARGAQEHTPWQNYHGNRTAVCPPGADLGQQTLSSPPTTHTLSAATPLSEQRGVANASGTEKLVPPMAPSSEHLEWCGSGLRARKLEGRVRAFAVAEMVGGEGWGRRGDEMGISGRWSALMQAFGLLHSRHRARGRKRRALSSASASSAPATGASSATRPAAVKSSTKSVATARAGPDVMPGQHAGKREREASGDALLSSGGDGAQLLKKSALHGAALKWQGGGSGGEGSADGAREQRGGASDREQGGGSSPASDPALATSIAEAPPQEVLAEIAQGRQKTMDLFVLQRQ